ncbi:peroxisomal 2,4 dienoyl-CoA reductase and sorbitol utilization protein [Scheffersomyces coipomensis]|uniref:peroxisomal 2,4 dienoyl-CoA reductase and sorbitol utilization protein n=1 Tax=Scheffersomyces coipomensis TaxID=1788519 RepID=UPI00315C5D50
MTIESSSSITPVSICNTDIGSLPAPFPQLSSNILDLFLLTNKHAVITGGARGIGYVISEAYLQAGISKLAIIDYSNNEPAINRLREQFPKSSINYYDCDVRKAEQVKNVIETIHKEFETIDIFVANAGIAWTSGPLIDQDNDDEWHNVMNVDLNGVYYCAKNIGKIFRQQGKGSLIMTASMSAHIVNVPQLQAAYNVAKAGVLHLSKSLAIEWAAFARVNTVSPGYIATELSDFVPDDIKNSWYALTPKGRQGAPRELCGAYLYLASDAATFTTGSDIKVDGGYCSV